MVRTHRQSGFTAIELAVVLGLILVMVGLTLPAISRSMRKGRLAESTSTFMGMHQQAILAAQQYRMTWGEFNSQPGATAHSVTLRVLADRIVFKYGFKDSAYNLPPTVEAQPLLNPITYASGTGFTNLPLTQVLFRTLDGADKTRISIAESGLTTVVSE